MKLIFAAILLLKAVIGINFPKPVPIIEAIMQLDEIKGLLRDDCGKYSFSKVCNNSQNNEVKDLCNSFRTHSTEDSEVDDAHKLWVLKNVYNYLVYIENTCPLIENAKLATDLAAYMQLKHQRPAEVSINFKYKIPEPNEADYEPQDDDLESWKISQKEQAETNSRVDLEVQNREIISWYDGQRQIQTRVSVKMNILETSKCQEIYKNDKECGDGHVRNANALALLVLKNDDVASKETCCTPHDVEIACKDIELDLIPDDRQLRTGKTKCVGKCQGNCKACSVVLNDCTEPKGIQQCSTFKCGHGYGQSADDTAKFSVHESFHTGRNRCCVRIKHQVCSAYTCQLPWSQDLHQNNLECEELLCSGQDNTLCCYNQGLKLYDGASQASYYKTQPSNTIVDAQIKSLLLRQWQDARAKYYLGQLQQAHEVVEDSEIDWKVEDAFVKKVTQTIQQLADIDAKPWNIPKMGGKDMEHVTSMQRHVLQYGDAKNQPEVKKQAIRALQNGNDELARLVKTHGQYQSTLQREAMFAQEDAKEIKTGKMSTWKGHFVLCCGRRPQGARKTLPQDISLTDRIPVKNCLHNTSQLYNEYPFLKVKCPPIADPLGIPDSYKCTHDWFKAFMDGEHQDGNIPRKKFKFMKIKISLKRRVFKKLYPLKAQQVALSTGEAAKNGIQECMLATLKEKDQQCIYQKGQDPLLQQRRKNGSIKKTAKTTHCDHSTQEAYPRCLLILAHRFKAGQDDPQLHKNQIIRTCQIWYFLDDEKSPKNILSLLPTLGELGGDDRPELEYGSDNEEGYHEDL